MRARALIARSQAEIRLLVKNVFVYSILRQ